ncbi:MAG: hypothetical protein ABFD49_05340 [Armatimonadota bacterium]|nr:hypothetical protein [bacterium]
MQALRKKDVQEVVNIKEAVSPSEEATAPVSEDTETTPVYHNSVNTTFFNQDLMSDDVDGLYDHLNAILKILGVKWQSDKPFDGDTLGAYIRNEGEQAMLFTGTHLPSGVSGHGVETEITLVARAVALHLSTMTNGVNDSVHAVWTWEPPTQGYCESICQVQESLNPCAMCRLNGVCKLKEKHEHDRIAA